MQLIEWLDKNDMTQREVAKHLGLSESRLSRLCNGNEPTLQQVFDIENLTGGKVTMEDFLKAAKPKPNGEDHGKEGTNGRRRQ